MSLFSLRICKQIKLIYIDRGCTLDNQEKSKLPLDTANVAKGTKIK